VTRLSEVPVGESAVVKTVKSLDEVGCRLLEMGLTPGVPVLVVGTAPFGDPIEIELRGYHLSLRKSEAALVEIESY
jgi:ferrous iron transport protein A